MKKQLIIICLLATSVTALAQQEDPCQAKQVDESLVIESKCIKNLNGSITLTAPFAKLNSGQLSKNFAATAETARGLCKFFGKEYVEGSMTPMGLTGAANNVLLDEEGSLADYNTWDRLIKTVKCDIPSSAKQDQCQLKDHSQN